MVDRIREDLLVNHTSSSATSTSWTPTSTARASTTNGPLDVDDVMGEINALRSLGSRCLSATPFHDPEKGDRYFERALELSRHNIDEYSIYTTGYTLESWGWALVGANHPAGLDRVQQAAETYAGC